MLVPGVAARVAVLVPGVADLAAHLLVGGVAIVAALVPGVHPGVVELAAGGLPVGLELPALLADALTEQVLGVAKLLAKSAALIGGRVGRLGPQGIAGRRELAPGRGGVGVEYLPGGLALGGQYLPGGVLLIAELLAVLGPVGAEALAGLQLCRS